MEKKRRFRTLAKPKAESYLYVSKQGGQVRISYGLARRMNIREGDRVSLFLEEDGFDIPELYIAKHSTGFVLRNCTANVSDCTDIRSVRFYSKETVSQLLRGNGSSTLKLRVGESFTYDNVEYFTVIYNASENKLQGINKVAIGR